jgi:HPt (histidine-containing phosphotransfer) domain-containing protein
MKLPEDPFILELLPEFIDTWINDIKDQLDTIISSKDSDELYRFGHTIKGSCLQFGIEEIAFLGIEMMGYVKAKDFDNAQVLGDKILQSFIEANEFVASKLKNN